MGKWTRLVVMLAVLGGLHGCAAHKVYRSEMSLCAAENLEQVCRDHAYQRYENAADPDGSYDLAFIEFDDQGQLQQRRQMRFVLDQLYTDAADHDLLMVVFVHGWKHSAAPGDPNIETFRRSLIQLARLERAVGRRAGQQAPRRVVGIYIGWRGGSIELPGIKELTFWDRKKTAHKVGHGGVTEVLAHLEQLKKTKQSVTAPAPARTRLVTVGHSFGGAVVYSALAQVLAGRFVDTVGPVGQISSAEGFGDLVVLINPAFEAMRYAQLSDMANERRRYFDNQLPVLAILTSEADDATGIAFPLGRSFSTVFEKHRQVERVNGATGQPETIDQADANVTAIGHFEPYRTHFLHARGAREQASRTEVDMQVGVDRVLEAIARWQDDHPGSQIPFDGSMLERTQTSVGRNPYLNVYVDNQLIRDHNDIDDPRIASFLRDLILIASDGADPSVKSQVEMQRRLMK